MVLVMGVVVGAPVSSETFIAKVFWNAGRDHVSVLHALQARRHRLSPLADGGGYPCGQIWSDGQIDQQWSLPIIADAATGRYLRTDRLKDYRRCCSWSEARRGERDQRQAGGKNEEEPESWRWYSFEPDVD